MGALGSKEGLDPSVEKRQEVVGRKDDERMVEEEAYDEQTLLDDEFSDMSSHNPFGGELILQDEQTYGAALKEVLKPSVAPTLLAQVVKEGLLKQPGSRPKHVVIIAEEVPTWLAIVDGWGAEQLFLHCPKEADWYRPNMDLLTSVSAFPTVAGLAQANWRHEPNVIITIQGSALFCKEMVNGLISLGIKTSHKIIVTSNERCKNLKLSFKFLRLSHDTLGGSTNQETHVGFSRGCDIAEKVEFALGIPSTIGDHICPMENGKTVVCPLDACALADSTAINSKSVVDISTATQGEFIVPSLFAKTKWVERQLTDAEILSVMDTPVRITKAVNESPSNIDLKNKVELVEKMIPLKILQEVSRLLFKFDIPKQRAHTIPIYDVMRLGPGVSGLDAIYDQIDQAKVAKNDDAAVNTHLWNEAVFDKSNLSLDMERDILKKDLILSEEEVFALEALRACQSKVYKKNVRKSFVRHMQTAYSSEGLDSNSDIRNNSYEFKRDMEEGRKAVGKAANASFWEWEDGSFPLFWRWQPEVKKDLRDGTPLWVHNSKLPKGKSKRQRLPKDPDVFSLMTSKILEVRRRGYIDRLLKGSIESLTHYFAVPKGDSDIRMVYDLTASGLNDALWAPTFWLPNIRNVLDCSILEGPQLLRE